MCHKLEKLVEELGLSDGERRFVEKAESRFGYCEACKIAREFKNLRTPYVELPQQQATQTTQTK